MAVANDGESQAKETSSDTITTGVARGRDRLDSATSTSAMNEIEIHRLSARSLAEILRNFPGVRAEVGLGEGNNNISIRGLPMASTGAKFLQLQEDGLPVLEFGDLAAAGSDMFLRADINLARIEAIRGGSASTFASNSPGGIVNLISKTGDVEGGAVELTAGLDYENYRLDFDYGAKISDSLRFHIGGFYRQGEGSRRAGYDAYKGGQLKFNVTKEFTSGYVRLYGKWLDDRVPAFIAIPFRVSGSNAKPNYQSFPGFDIRRDSMLSRYNRASLALDGTNNPVLNDLADGQRAKTHSIGLEAQVEIADWIVTERFRYAKMSARFMDPSLVFSQSAADVAALFGGPRAELAYATGPQAGSVIANPATLNSNGLLGASLVSTYTFNSLDNATNDVRASKVWNLAGGKLTTTVGMYNARQSFDADWSYSSVLSDVRGGGKVALVNIIAADGTPVTQNGRLSYGTSGLYPVIGSRAYRVDYATNAAFGSLNFQIGRIAIGGSLRYDFGSAIGTLFGAELGDARQGIAVIDIDRDGFISRPEQAVDVLPLSRPGPLDYDYNNLSYSTGINFRASEPLAVFARYSKGARVNSDRFAFTPFLNPITGGPFDRSALIDFVRQAEVGVKFRKDRVTLNLTGFWAGADEHNAFDALISREYSAYGFEFEGGYRRGPFSLTLGATYTDSQIKSDANQPQFNGNTPAGQPSLFFQAVPAADFGELSLGASVFGMTGRYTTDANSLRMPGYVIVSPFIQFRPHERVQLSLNVNNLFDTVGIVQAGISAIPSNGMAVGQVINGRTISGSLRFGF